MALLFKQWGSEIKVIKEVVKAIVGNTGSGKEVILFFLE